MKRTFTRATLALAIAQSSLALADPPANSAYGTDTQNSHVEDATSRGIGQVNMITCIMSSLRPDATVNDGPYNALVDQTKCDQNSRASTSNASGDGSQAANYMNGTVNSTRATNSDPMRARVWLDDTEVDGAVIFVNISASAPPSANNPYGQFRLDYCGHGEDGSTDCLFNGFLEGTANGVAYFEREQGDGGSGSKALRMTTSSATSGSGSLHMANPNESSTFSFAYNADYYRRSDDGGDQCFARDARDADTGMSVWRYGLYDSVTGARVERESGFPIEYTNGGVKYQGYLGYYGLSLPPAAQGLLANGDTVEKVDYGNGNAPTRTPFTVVKSGGKLMKYTRHTRTLHEMDQIKFTTFVGMEASSMFAGAQANAQYEMFWDDASGTFTVTGLMVCGGNGCMTQPLNSEQSVAATFWQPRGGIQAWSQQLGGELFVNLQTVSTPVDSAAIQVAYRSQDVVYPSAMPVALHCLRDCPTAASIAAYFDGGTVPSPFAGTTANNFQPTVAANVVSYNSNAEAAMLRDDTAAAVVLDVDVEQLEDSQQYRHGLRSGKLFVNLTDVECSLGSGTYCDWRVNNLDVYYQWETGPNQHNQFAAVMNADGEFVNLDPPLHVSFQVPQGATYGEHAGQSIVLQYGGFGDLWGIPGVCVSPMTNEEVPCDNSGENRYVPSFVIPYDTTIGKVTSGGTTYLVKWLEREIRFARKDIAVCDTAGLTVPSGIILPTVSDLKNPSDSASDIYIGVRPSVSTAPRVIHGEVMY